MSQTIGSNGKVRRPKTSLASPAELELLVRALTLDALAIVPMYRRLHSLGLEPHRGDSVHVSGGGHSDVPYDALENERMLEYQRYGARITTIVKDAADALMKAQQSLERNVGPAPGFRQPQTIGSDAIVTVVEFAVSLENQAQRMKGGRE